MMRLLAAALLLLSSCAREAGRLPEPDPPLRVGAAAVEIEADDSMVIGGSIHPGKAKGQEGKLRAVALVVGLADQNPVAIVACDVLMMNRDLLDSAIQEIYRTTGIWPRNVLINATHTHHAPSSCTVHGYERDAVFMERVQKAVVQAVHRAFEGRQDGRFFFARGEESSVGQNSRLLLGDGTIFWIGDRKDAVRPTGPFDPELPVLAFKGASDAEVKALFFNHSTHTIRTRKPGVRSPSFYGLAAQELEKELDGVVGFLEGASGSTHNLDLSCDEMIHRIKAAVRETLARAEPQRVRTIASIKREIAFRIRRFDDAREDEAVGVYCRKRAAAGADGIIDVFRKQRAVLAPLQGQERKTWIQALRIGDVALVGVPAEFFTTLGLEIKRRSPFRYTYVAELANDWIGYLPDRKAFELGGYQTWTGLHSYAEPGTGENVVDQAVEMLREIHGGR